MGRTLAAVSFLAVCLGAAAALACSAPDFPDTQRHIVDPEGQQTDGQPPGVVEIVSYLLVRGEPIEETGCGDPGCSPVGGLALEIVPPADNVSASYQLGYEVEFESGKSIFEQPVWPIRAQAGVLYLTFYDGGEERFTDRIRVRAIDLAGNAGTFSEYLEVSGPGKGAGCGTGGAGGGADLAVGLLAAVVGLGLLRRKG